MPPPDSIRSALESFQAPPADSIRSVLDGLSEPARPAYTPFEDAASESHVKYAEESATFDQALIKDMGRGLSLWDEQLQQTAKRTKPLAEFTPEDHIGQITAFMNQRGLRIDERAVNGERAAGVLETSDRAFTRFMVDSGLKDVATKEEGLQIRHAFLFLEVGRRSSLSPAEYDKAGSIAMDQLIAEQVRVLGATSQPGLDYPQRFQALSRLQNASDDLKRIIARRAMTNAGDVMNDAEKLYYNTIEDRVRGAWTELHKKDASLFLDLKNNTQGEAVAALMKDVETAWGTRRPDELVAGRVRSVLDNYHLKDLGFLKGDITKKGILQVDPLGVTAVQLLPDETILKLEKRARERGITPGKSSPAAEMLAAAEERLSNLARRNTPEVPTFGPEAAAALGPTTNAFLAISDQLSRIQAGATRVLLAADEGAGAIGLDAASRFWVEQITQNPRLARDVKTPVKALATVLDLATETGQLFGRLGAAVNKKYQAFQAGLAAQFATDPEQIQAALAAQQIANDGAKAAFLGAARPSQTPSEVDGDAFRDADPALLRAALAETNQAGRLMQMGAVEAERDQEERTKRMAAKDAFSKDPLAYMKDVAGTLWYQFGASARDTFATVVDNPEQLALLVVGEKAGDAAFSGIARARRTIFQNFYNGAKLREAGNLIGRYLPAKIDEILDYLHLQIERGGNHAAATAALSKATGAAEALAGEIRDGLQKGAIDLTTGTVRLFSKGLADVLKLPGIQAPKAVQTVLDHIGYKPTTLEAANLLRAATALTAKKPRRLSLRFVDSTAQAAEDHVLKTTSQLLGESSAPESYVRLQLEHSRLRAAGDTVGAEAVAKKLAAYQSPNGRGAAGPIDALRLANERDNIVERLPQINTRIDAARRRLVKDTSDAAKLELQLAMDEAKVARRRVDEIGVQLHKAPNLEAVDVAQLMIAKDTGKLRYTFFTEAAGKAHDMLAKLFGAGSFDEIRNAADAADRAFSFDGQRAFDWSAEKTQQSVVKLRNKKVYDATIARFDAESDARQALMAHQRAKSQAAPDPVSAAEARRTFDALVKEDIAAKATQDSLVRERQAMLSMPEGSAWHFQGTQLSRFVDMDQLTAIVRVYQDHFDFADLQRIGLSTAEETEALRRQTAGFGREIEEKSARHGAAKTRRRDLADALEKNPPPDPGPEPAPQIQQRTTATGEEGTAVDLNAAAKRKHTADTAERARRLREVEQAAAEEEVLGTDLKRLRKDRRNLERRISTIERQDVDAQRRLLARFSYGGAKQEMKRAVELLRQDANSVAAIRDAGLHVNPWLQGTLPLHLKGRAIGEGLRLARNTAQIGAYQLEALADELQSRAPAERAIIGRAIAEGRVPADLKRTHPDLAWQLEQLTPDQRADFDSNLERYLKYERGVQSELLEAARATGMLEQGPYDNLRRSGYDPGLYNWQGALNIVRGDASAALKASRGKGSGAGGFLSGDEFRLKRDHSKFRVVVQDPDSTITERHFDTAAAADDWVKTQFPIDKLEAEGHFRSATTKNGTKVTVAEPLGEEALAVLGFNPNMTAERRLQRFSALNQDIAIHRFLNGQRSVAGMVLTPEEFHTTAQRIGSRSSDFERQYLRLPENRPDKFGTMAGMYVHRKIVTEMNGARHMFDGLQSWLTSLGEFYSDFSQFAPKLFGKIPVASTKLTENWFQAVKFSQILLSPRTWFGNMTFNMFADQFVGGRVLAPQNWDNLKTALSILTAAKDRPRELLRMDMTLFNEATRHGVINGSVFNSDASRGVRGAFLRAMSLEGEEEIRGRLGQLAALREKETAALLKRSGAGPERLEDIAVLQAAHEDALRDFEKGYVRRLGRELSGMFLNKKGARGLPLSRFGSGLRETYGLVDDVYRLAAFMNLRRGGLNAAQASQRILDFAQNYGNVPAAVNTLARSPFGSLVPAFPMELARLTKNYATKQPLRFAALLSVIPAVNAVMMGMSGMSVSRYAAAMRASGAQTTAEMVNELTSTLMVPDPRNHNVASTIDLGTTFQPVGQVFSDYGMLSQMADTWIPKTNDSFLANAGRVGAKFAGAYVLNNPLVNGAAGLLFNKDTVTGRTLVGEGASTMEALHAGHKLFTQALVPPWMPVFGRAAEDAYRAIRAPLHPETGRPINAQDLGTVLSRSLFGVAVKGKLAGAGPQVNDQLLMISLMYGAERAAGGAKYAKDLQVFGTDADKREFWAMMRASSPERKSEAERELRKLAAAEKEFTVNGQTYSKVGTEREEERYIDAVLSRGALDHFNGLDLRVQTAVLIEADRAQVNNSTLQSFSDAARLDQRWMEQVPGDPAQVQQAIQMIDSWAPDPRSSPATKQWRQWLREVLDLSVATYEVEKIRRDVQNQLKQEGVLRK